MSLTESEDFIRTLSEGLGPGESRSFTSSVTSSNKRHTTILGFEPANIWPGETRTFVTSSDYLVKPKRILISNGIAERVSVIQIQIGKVKTLPSGLPIPGVMFSLAEKECPLGGLSFTTIQIGNQLQLTVRNDISETLWFTAGVLVEKS